MRHLVGEDDYTHDQREWLWERRMITDGDKSCFVYRLLSCSLFHTHSKHFSLSNVILWVAVAIVDVCCCGTGACQGGGGGRACY